MSSVYLIHFEPAFKHAQHYAGYSDRQTVNERVKEHFSGRGSRLCKHALNAGVRLMLVRVWDDVPRQFERKIKGRSLKPLCPICTRDYQLTKYCSEIIQA